MVYNVIIFGGSGSGKTSVINMLLGYEAGAVSSGARGCTFESQAYYTTIRDRCFRIYDTAGFEEGEAGRVPAVEAIVQLHNLVKGLSDGVSLLVFCMRAPRIKESSSKNWKLFYEIICQRKVPICIAVTGLEQEEHMDDWWHHAENRSTFQRYDIFPSSFACITATKGKRRLNGNYLYQEEYDESKAKVSNMIYNHHMMSPWKAEPVEWFKQIIETTYETDCWGNVEEKHKKVTVDGSGMKALMERCGFSEPEARDLVRRLCAEVRPSYYYESDSCAIM